jgi:signal transduction histidine kinase
MPKLSSIWSYAVAVLSVALALAAGVLLDTYLQTAPYVSLFLCAILFVAWFGGIGPGLLAAALAIIASEYCCLPPWSGLPLVRGDRIQLQQVIINLVNNGVQAMSNITDRPRLLSVRTRPHESDQVLVAVQDAGVGIETEDSNRLFTAFYTTKSDGLGIGLSICRSIILAHGGRVWASRNDGPGMTFQFTLSTDRSEVSSLA